MRVATDIGGTFTDLAWCEFNPATGTVGPVHDWKCDTTPGDLAAGVMDVLSQAKISIPDVGFFAHGTTAVINAISERNGAKVGLITTKGFRDVLEIARGNRPDLFNFRFRKPPPFVERYLRREVDERANTRGEVARPVDRKGLAELVAFFKSEQVEALAVAFLHAYANPTNELAAIEMIRELWPEIPVVASHQTTREWREYERTNTAVLSAYVAPVCRRYLAGLETRLNTAGLKKSPFIMQSNGGVTTVDRARANPIAIIESGPASGVLGAAALAQAMGRPQTIALDIGGTTAKCSLIDGGKPTITTDYYIEANRENPGYPVKTPVVDIIEIGTGGGSIARVDEGGKLHVGPQSAGAIPGPVVYGRGGTRPTVTDAHVLTGRIDSTKVLGREGRADMAAVRAAYTELGRAIGAGPEETAEGVIRIADANMENALKLVSINRGYDPRDFSLVAFGGGGPLHAATLAAALNIPEVIIPANAAVFSAWGMLQTDVRSDHVRTATMRLDSVDPAEAGRLFADLEAEAQAGFTSEPEARVVLERAADMRYRGQEHTVRVTLPSGTVDTSQILDWAERFRQAHDRLYRIRLEVEVEVVTLHLTAYQPIAKPKLIERKAPPASSDPARTGKRQVRLGGVTVEVTVYDRTRLVPGMRLDGPAIAEERGTVIIIPPGHKAEVDGFANLVIRTGG
ncbi:MAG: hydantoinase/oxoprolinase family protein [Rhodospirillales bacterium]|nr:hydantoinase/oxoprolinase family protein [Rhodospirillales bacterium]